MARPLEPGFLITGPLFNEPMRVETVRQDGPGTWSVGLVGVYSDVHTIRDATGLLQRADEEISKASEEVAKGTSGSSAGYNWRPIEKVQHYSMPVSEFAGNQGGSS